MPQRLDRSPLRATCDAHPLATYAELSVLTGIAPTTISRIVREEFGDERRARLTVVEDHDDFRRGATFAQQDFLTSAWAGVWPDGLRVADGSGTVYVVETWKRKHTLRQRLVGDGVVIEPGSTDGVAVVRGDR